MTDDMDLVCKVAEAINTAEPGLVDPDWQIWIDEARAAIAAVRAYDQEHA